MNAVSTPLKPTLRCDEQGLTLRFQARGPKRYFDKSRGQKQHFCMIINTISGPKSEKSRDPQQNLGAYAWESRTLVMSTVYTYPCQKYHACFHHFFHLFLLQGMEYLLTNNLVDDTCLEIAKFFHGTRRMDWFQKREYLKTRYVYSLSVFVLP